MTITQDVLASMFTENTGTHMLDSGGAYGRNWERNQGKHTEDFVNAPDITLSVAYDYVDVTLDAFHFLDKRLDYDAHVDRVFDLFVALRNEPNDPWLVEMEAFADAVDEHTGTTYDKATCINSYNEENLLSQTIQLVAFKWIDDDWYVLLQIHGGCDVRGGYTRPRAFRIMDSNYNDWYSLTEWQDYTLDCTVGPDTTTEPLFGSTHPEPHYVDVRGSDITNNQGCLVTESDLWPDGMIYKPDEDDSDTWFLRCPYCTEPTPMRAYTND